MVLFGGVVSLVHLVDPDRGCILAKVARVDGSNMDLAVARVKSNTGRLDLFNLTKIDTVLADSQHP